MTNDEASKLKPGQVIWDRVNNVRATVIALYTGVGYDTSSDPDGAVDVIVEIESEALPWVYALGAPALWDGPPA